MEQMTYPAVVDVREVGPRDGLQIEDPISTEAKLQMIDNLVAAGARRIEATSFVSPKAVPALADAEDVAAELWRWPAVHFSALVAGMGGVQRALRAGVRDLEYVVSAADGHSRANVARDTADSLKLIAPITKAVHEAGGRVEVIVATAWDCPFDGQTPPERTLEVVRRARADGADAISIADTIGTVTPGRLVPLVRRAMEVAGDLDVGVHLHNTRGNGLASALAALQVGVTSLDASIGGLGGCPFAPGASGNIATEELVYLLDDLDITTGLDLDALLAAARSTERAIGKSLPSGLLRAGDRIRAHYDEQKAKQ
jgi:hydroxymethylglutaryl-CoA lyase